MRFNISSIGGCCLNDTREAKGASIHMEPNTALEEISLLWSRAACKGKRLNEEVNYYIPRLGTDEKVKGENSLGQRSSTGGLQTTGGP